MKLNNEELKIIKFWYLSCEDHSIAVWHEFCESCPIKEKCKKLVEKLFGGNSNIKETSERETQ